jgi:hypothetical protein
MPTTTTPDSVEGANIAVLQAPTLQWALKRTLIGIVILFVTIATAATLLYASIDPDQELDQPALSVPAAADPAQLGAPSGATEAFVSRRV